MKKLKTDEPASGNVQEIFDEITIHFGMVPNFFSAQAEADPAWLELNWSRWKVIMGQERSLDRKTKELIAVAVSIVNNCEYCTLAHEASALMVGSSEEEIIEMKEVVELFSSFTKIATSLNIPCDITPAMVKEKK
ncbi:MAG: carboxymuconolactone decarboxylase family protein [Methylococcales bacterium]